MKSNNPSPLFRGCLFSLIPALLLWGCIGCLLSGCVAQGSWDYHGELLGNKWSIGATYIPPKKDELPVTLDFSDWFARWWESLWQEPAQALKPGATESVTTMTTVGQPPG